MKISNLPLGETAPGAGAYRTPIEHHHSQRVAPGPSVSSTGLRTIWGTSPWAFWSTSALNPSRFEPEETGPMRFGRAFHSFAFDDEWTERFAVPPSRNDYPDLLETTDDIREWLRRHGEKVSGSKAQMIERAVEAGCDLPIWDLILGRFKESVGGKELVDPSDYEHMVRMKDRLLDHPLVKAGALDGKAEISMVWPSRTGESWLKSRIDLMPASGFATDLKTTTNAHPQKAAYDIRMHRYDMQLALAQWACREILGHPRTECSLIFVEKTPPYGISHVVIDPETLDLAEVECRNAVRSFETGLRTGEWPDYHDSTYRMREWDAERVHEAA